MRQSFGRGWFVPARHFWSKAYFPAPSDVGRTGHGSHRSANRWLVYLTWTTSCLAGRTRQLRLTCHNQHDVVDFSINDIKVASDWTAKHSEVLSDLIEIWWSVSRQRRASRRRDAEPNRRFGGAYRDRTDDPLLAKQVLSQLS